MAELIIKDKAGKQVGTHTLSDVFAKVHASTTTIHRTVVPEEANKRQGTQKTKTRAEIRGGGRKPYKQKKTGNARQGSTRSPHYAHGAMALALTPRDYDKKVNRRERRAAILAAFNAQAEAGNVHIVDSITFATPKTSDAIALLNSLGLVGARRVLVILPTYDEVAYKSLRNIPYVEVRTAPTSEEGGKAQPFSARDLLVSKNIVVAKDAIAKIEEVWGK